MNSLKATRNNLGLVRFDLAFLNPTRKLLEELSPKLVVCLMRLFWSVVAKYATVCACGEDGLPANGNCRSDGLSRRQSRQAHPSP